MGPVVRHAWLIRVAAVGAALMSAVSSAHAEPNKDILTRAESYKQPALKLLETLVNIDSGSADEMGLNKVADTVAGELKALGAQIEP